MPGDVCLGRIRKVAELEVFSVERVTPKAAWSHTLIPQPREAAVRDGKTDRAFASLEKFCWMVLARGIPRASQLSQGHGL